MSKLVEIMKNCRPEPGPELDEEVENLAKETSWSVVLSDAYSLLSSLSKKEYWHDAICIICWAANDGIKSPLNSAEVVARLYWCLKNDNALGCSDYGENLVWSTTIDLLGIYYMSDWQPLEDPKIKQIMRKFDN